MNPSQTMDQESVKYVQSFNLVNVGESKCHNHDRFGHWARYCTTGKIVQKSNCANQMEVTGNLFYVNNVVTEPKVDGDWYIDRLQQSHDRECNVLVDVKTNVAEKFKCVLVC